MECDALVDHEYRGASGASVQGAPVYGTVAAALDDAPPNSAQPYLILIRNGRYYEKLTIDKPSITIIGEDRERTVLTFDAANGRLKADGTPYGTSGSASVTVRASDFRAENLTIENGFDYPANVARPENDPGRVANAQAVALKTEGNSDRAFFKNVRFVGYQDTLYVDAGRQYFTQCTISGHIDFIFGAGAAVFEDSDIVSRDRNDPQNNGYITAASTPSSRPYGFLFVNCRLKRETPALADGSVALGRPWHPTRDLPDGTRAADPNAAGSVIFKHCWMDGHIATRGWDAMAGRDKTGQTIWFGPADARFYEYASTGPGAHRSGTRRVLTDAEAEEYIVEHVLNGWNP